MADFSSSTITELGNDSTEFYWLVEMDFSTPIRVTNYTDDVSYDSKTFTADATITGLPKSFKETLKMQPNGVRFQMAGSLLTNQTVLLTENYNNVEVNLYLYVPGTDEVYLTWNGSIDRPQVKENIRQGVNVIEWSCNSHWSRLKNVKGRILNVDAQKKLYTGDTGFKYVGRLDSSLSNWNSDDSFDTGWNVLDNVLNGATSIIEGALDTLSNVADNLSSLFGGGSSDAQKKERQEVNAVQLPNSSRRLPVIYGEGLVKPIEFFLSLDPEDDTVLYVGYLLCEGEIDSITDIIFRDNRSYTDSKYSSNVTLVDSRLGTGDDLAYSDLTSTFSSLWTTNDRLRGCATILVKYTKGDMFSGKPRIMVKVKGKKIYDPRDASTAWSNNPVLAYRDYLTNDLYGVGLDSGKFDDDVISTEATYAETTYTDHDESGGGTATSVKLFGLDGVINTDSSLEDNINKMLFTMRGFNVWRSGKYSLVIEKPSETSVMSFDESNMSGDFMFYDKPVKDKYNAVYYELADERYNYTKNTAVQESTTYLSEDNGINNHIVITNLLEKNFYRATNRCGTVLKKSRSSYSIQFMAAKTDAIKVKVGELIDVSRNSFGWTNKLFRVTEKTTGLNGDISFFCQEYTSTDFDWSVSVEDVPPADTYLPDFLLEKIKSKSEYNTDYISYRSFFETIDAFTSSGNVTITSGGVNIIVNSSNTSMTLIRPYPAGNSYPQQSNTIHWSINLRSQYFGDISKTFVFGIGTYDVSTPNNSEFIGFRLGAQNPTSFEIRPICYDGTSGTIGTTITRNYFSGVQGSDYVFRFVATSTSVKFYVGGVFREEITTNIPTINGYYNILYIEGLYISRTGTLDLDVSDFQFIQEP